MIKQAVGGRGRRWVHKAGCGEVTLNLSLDTEFGKLDGVEKPHYMYCSLADKKKD